MLKYNGGSIIFHNFNRDASGAEILNILRDLWIGFSESLLTPRIYVQIWFDERDCVRESLYFLYIIIYFILY